MDQPSDGQTTAARKQCWGCMDEWIAYDRGFCPECWNKLTEVEQQAYQIAAWCSPTVGGAIRSALAQRIKDLRRASRPYTPLPREAKRKLVLPDLDLDLGDLEL